MGTLTVFLCCLYYSAAWGRAYLVGFLWAIYLKRVTLNDGEVVAAITPNTHLAMHIGKAHNLLGHMNEDMTRKSATALGWTITRGALGPCGHCAESKARRKNIAKAPNTGTKPATKDADRLYLDQSTLRRRNPALGSSDQVGTPYKIWNMQVLEYSGLKMSKIYPTKNAMIEPTCQRLHLMKQHGMMPKYIRLDNAGENKKLQKRAESKDWKLSLTWEFTAEGTPQQNAPAEVALQII